MTSTEATAAELRPVIAEAAKEAVRRTAGLDNMDAAGITHAVTKEVTAAVVNATNQEPWYQSRVTIGALMTLVGGSYALGLDFLDGTLPTPESLTAQLGAIVGAAVVIYGRWFGRKPLGQ